jgi:outer membrane protein OmpA-like peptidoglycan-associated protein
MSKSRFLLATIVLVASSVAGTTSVSATTATTWTSVSSPPAGKWKSITYGNGVFVAVAESGTNRIAMSANGTEWQAQSAPVVSYESVTFGNGIFVAVSGDGTDRAFTSTNGTNWVSRSIVEESWRLVTYGNGTFLAVASNRKTATSSDGITWIPGGQIPFASGQTDLAMTSVAYGNGVFTVVGDNGESGVDRRGVSAISTDNGANWTTTVIDVTNNFWRSVVFADVPQIGPQFVAVGWDTNYVGRAMVGTFSGSSVTWTVSGQPIQAELSSVTYAEGIFVAVADSGNNSRVVLGRYIGTDLQWAPPMVNPPSQQWKSVTYGDGLFVAVASNNNGHIMTSGTFTGGNQTPEPTPNVGNAPATDSNSGSSTPSGGSDPIPSASQPGVTVTDSKIYTTLPRRVADNSSIAVLTARQTRTQRLRTQTPAVCLTTNDDIVFIDEGRCNVSVLSKKTGEVLRRLRTTVIDTEVVELGIGNEIATLAPIYFENGSSNLSRAASRRIASLKDRISEAGSVLVVGHTGIMTGDTAENRALSRSRAVNTVREMKRSGAVGPFFSVAVGAANPDVNDTSRSAQSKNRRVVIVLVP